MRGKVFVARKEWINKVEARDVEAVVGLYAENGILLGTMDTAKPRIGHEAIKDYFDHFLANDKVTANFPEKITDKDIRQLGLGFVMYSGYYDFILEKNSKVKIAHAKFTYIYKIQKNGELLIVHHNSGLTPEGITLQACPDLIGG